MRRAAGLLATFGHELAEAAPPVDAQACALDFMTIVAVETRVSIEQAARLAGVAPKADGFEAETWAVGLLGRAISAPEYSAAIARLQLAARQVALFFEQHDLLLTPTLAAPPLPIGALAPSAAERGAIAVVNALGAGGLLRALKVIEPMAAKTFAFMPYTALFNVTGQPAMSVPLHWNAEGLPVGVQFVGRFGEDALLLRLAAQLEAELPWFDRVPSL
jgi:amidase